MQTLLGDFGREQDNFVTWKTEMKRQESAAIAPWVGFVEEEVMKRHILALSMVMVSLFVSHFFILSFAVSRHAEIRYCIWLYDIFHWDYI